MASLKIINIGAHKTGTKSLRNLMRDLGFKTCRAGLWKRHRKEIENGDYSSVIDSLPTADFFSDSPYNVRDVYKVLTLMNVKFVLTIRDPIKWFFSFMRWSKQREYVNSDKSDVVFAYGYKIALENRAEIINNYVLRNCGILKHFVYTPARLCLLDVDLPDIEKIEVLSRFLATEINIKYPHENKSK